MIKNSESIQQGISQNNISSSSISINASSEHIVSIACSNKYQILFSSFSLNEPSNMTSIFKSKPQIPKIEDYLKIKTKKLLKESILEITKIVREFDEYSSNLLTNNDNETSLKAKDDRSTQTKRLLAVEHAFTEKVPPFSIIAVDIQPTEDDRCHLIARNGRGQIIFFAENIRSVKKESKILSILEKKTNILIIVNDFCDNELERMSFLQLMAGKASHFAYFQNLSHSLKNKLEQTYFQTQKILRDRKNIQLMILEGNRLILMAGLAFQLEKRNEFKSLASHLASNIIEEEDLLTKLRGKKVQSKRNLSFEMMVVNYWRVNGGGLVEIKANLIKLMQQKIIQNQQDLSKFGDKNSHYPQLVNVCKTCIECQKNKKKFSDKKPPMSKYICEGCSAISQSKVYLCLLCFSKYKDHLHLSKEAEAIASRKKRHSRIRRRAHFKNIRFNRRESQAENIKVESDKTKEDINQHVNEIQHEETKQDLIRKLNKITGEMFAKVHQLARQEEFPQAQYFLQMMMISNILKINELSKMTPSTKIEEESEEK